MIINKIQKIIGGILYCLGITLIIAAMIDYFINIKLPIDNLQVIIIGLAIVAIGLFFLYKSSSNKDKNEHSIVYMALFLGILIGMTPILIQPIMGMVTSEISKETLNENMEFSEVLEDCGKVEEDVQKLFCINREVKKNYNYTKPHKIPQPVDVTWEYGGACLDYVEIYNLAAERYNLNYETIRLDGKIDHVYSRIWLEDKFYCIADMKSLDCKSYGNAKERN